MSVAIASFAVFAASQVGTPGPANMTLLTTGARIVTWVAQMSVKTYLMWTLAALTVLSVLFVLF